MRPMSLGVPVILLSAFAGCCAMNAGIDGREEFVRQRTSQIGKVVDVSSVHPAALQIESLNEQVVRYVIGSKEHCLYEYRVERTSRVVQSWHYLSAPEKCASNRYYCGAW